MGLEREKSEIQSETPEGVKVCSYRTRDIKAIITHLWCRVQRAAHKWIDCGSLTVFIYFGPVHPVARLPVRPAARQPVRSVARQPVRPVARQSVRPAARRFVRAVRPNVVEFTAQRVRRRPESGFSRRALMDLESVGGGDDGDGRRD